MFSSQPEYKILVQLASSGQLIPQPQNFINDTCHDHVRKIFMPTVYELYAYQLQQKKRAIFIPLSEVLKLNLPNLHFSPLHWTSKVDDHLGRSLIDCSNRTFGCNRNSEEILYHYQKNYMVK
jgi:hypothetical protein